MATAQVGTRVANIPNVAAAFAVDDEDLNGECFIVGAEGEVEELVEKNLVIFGPETPAIGPGEVGTPIHLNDHQAQLFLAYNTGHLLNAGRSAGDAAKVAYVRLLAVRNGLISPDLNPAANNVKYNHAVRYDAAAVDALAAVVEGTPAHVDAITRALTGPVKKTIRRHFADYVCCVAYIFRVRGHHYKDDINDRYVSLWSRCLHKDTDIPLSWELMATDALHAIMPGHLDGFWINCADNARCAGALIKRLDSAPAGVAGVLALERGIDDVMMLFPGVVNQVPDAYREFRNITRIVKESRWGGSINSRFYGAQRVRVEEGKIGALASVVMGIYDQLASDSKLRESPALKRLAETAPATGGAIGLAARRAIQSERMTLIGAVVGAEPAAIE